MASECSKNNFFRYLLRHDPRGNHNLGKSEQSGQHASVVSTNGVGESEGRSDPPLREDVLGGGAS